MQPRKEAQRAKEWLFEACFPFWAARGVDPRGGFRERLTLDGAPIEDATSRVRVQARQTFVFAEAVRLGWQVETARALVRRGVDILLGPCRRQDQLFGRIVAAGGGLADPEADLYDNAFCLLALAAASQALKAPTLLDEADATLAALDAAMAHPSGGYREALSPPRLRRQNPHMHLFEALLALNAADPARGYLRRADALSALLIERFTGRDGYLREWFLDDWSPAPPPEGDLVEPGHMFEWVWLLGAQARSANGQPSPAQRALYAAALPFLDGRGLAPQSADVRGRIVDAGRRAWPQTEVVKAHCAAFEAGDAAALARATQTLDSLFTDYLAGVPAGGWRDRFSADGAPLAEDMPASTGYHIVLALSEYLRTAETAGRGSVM